MRRQCDRAPPRQRDLRRSQLRSSDQPPGLELHGALLIAAPQLDADPLAGCAQARADRLQPDLRARSAEATVVDFEAISLRGSILELEARLRWLDELSRAVAG